MSSVSLTVSQAHVMSSPIASSNELRLSGRFKVMVATLSATSNRMVSRSMFPLRMARRRVVWVHSLPRAASRSTAEGAKGR